jgi:hypothetical protein
MDGMPSTQDGHETVASDAARWHDGPTVKQRTAVQHLVRDLLDSLAPERPPARGNPPPSAVQLLRSPRGCILQATARAVSVSWFPASPSEVALGELRVIAWDGVVSRPGSANRAKHEAVPLTEVVLRPKEVDGAWAWRSTEGAVCDTATLAARCYALLASDAESTSPTRVSQSPARPSSGAAAIYGLAATPASR